MVKQTKPLWLKIGAGVCAGALAGGLAVGIPMANQEPVIVTEYQNVTVEKIVEVENVTKIAELEELNLALAEQLSELEPLAVEGQYKEVLQELALEELEDDRYKVADWLFDEYGFVIDEDDIRFRSIEDWSYDYDSEDLFDEDVEDVDAVIKVELDLKGEDELSDDNFEKAVELKFKYDNGRMHFKKITAL